MISGMGAHALRSRHVQGLLGDLYLHAHGWPGLGPVALEVQKSLRPDLIFGVVLRDPKSRLVSSVDDLVIRYWKKRWAYGGFFSLTPYHDVQRVLLEESSLSSRPLIISRLLTTASTHLTGAPTA